MFRKPETQNDAFLGLLGGAVRKPSGKSKNKRHSLCPNGHQYQGYATHLHECGTDIKLIQELLGHNDIQTTLRYTHVSNLAIEKIKSPFDQLNLEKDK